MNKVNGYNNAFYNQQSKANTVTERAKSISKAYTAQKTKSDDKAVTPTFDTVLKNVSENTSFSYTANATFSNNVLTTSISYSSNEIVNLSIEDYLSGMYVSSTQNSLPVTERNSSYEKQVEIMHGLALKAVATVKSPDVMQVTLGRNELPEFMETIEKALSNGESFADIIQKQNDKHIAGRNLLNVGGGEADLFFVNVNTGEVLDSYGKGRFSWKDANEMYSDIDGVKALADDFATFLRYRVFKQEGDNPAAVEALISQIKEKQSTYNWDRFDKPYANPGDEEIERRLNSGEMDVDNKEPIDQFIEAIGKHQDTLYANKVGDNKIEPLSREEMWKTMLNIL